MRLIVVIESDPGLLRKFLSDLSGMRHRVLTTKSGIRGIEMSRIGHPDLIILDIYPDELDCLRVIAGLQKEELTRDIPIILTGYKAIEELVTKTRKFGVVDFVVKPCETSTLMKKVNAVLEESDRKAISAKEDSASGPGIKIQKNGNRTLISFNKHINAALSEQLQRRAAAAAAVDVNGNVHEYIMDLRALPEMSPSDAMLMVQMINGFSLGEVLIIAGRHYGPIMSHDLNDNAHLFLSTDEIKRYLKYSSESA